MRDMVGAPRFVPIMMRLFFWMWPKLTAVAHTLYLHAFQLRNDVPFLLGVMAFLTGYEAVQRRWRGDQARGPVQMACNSPNQFRRGYGWSI